MLKGDQYIQVYYNFHKECLSIQNRKGIVIAYRNDVLLKDVVFWVSEAGRQRVLREERKNVHAKIRGLYRASETPELANARRVRYNPYLFETFVYADTEDPVHEANEVFVRGNEMFVVA